MKRDFRAYLLGTVCLVACAANAQAGGLMEPRGSMKDAYMPPIGGGMKDAPMIAPTSGGWYLRGDVGYTRYGNVGGYIGEHQTYVGSNEIGSDGTLNGDFDSNCRMGSADDYQYRDRTFPVNEDGTRVIDPATGLPATVAGRVIDGEFVAYRDADGNTINADGYVYWSRATDTGSEDMRFRPDVTFNGGVANNIWDADGGLTPQVNGADVESAGVWQNYNAATERWENVARVREDLATDALTYESWDYVNGGWGAVDQNGNAQTAQTIVDVVRAFSSAIPEGFLRTSTQQDSSREQGWLNMEVMHAGRALCNVGRSVLHNVDIDNTWNLGGGVGYYFTNNWRGDLTFDYRFGSDVRATDTFLDSWGTTSIRAYHDTELSSFLTLANVYYDFGDRRGFSPYVGGGLGLSVNRLEQRKITCEYMGPDDASWSDCGGTTMGSGDSNVSVAAAAMVGFSQALSGNMKLDAGYRFLYLGDAKSGNELAGADAGSQGQLVLEDITAHEFRIGVRYEFGGRR